MQTDIDSFKALYRSFGIECKEFVGDDDSRRIRLIESAHGCDENETGSKLFSGYYGFYTEIIFDKDGKFLGQGFWE